jgi:hypothetical protein
MENNNTYLKKTFVKKQKRKIGGGKKLMTAARRPILAFDINLESKETLLSGEAPFIKFLIAGHITKPQMLV